MSRRRRRLVALIPCLLAIALGLGCSLPGKWVRVGVQTDSNLHVYLDNESQRNRVNVRLFVDGQEICPPQDVRNVGMRPVIHEVGARVEKGEHILRIEAFDAHVSAEARFVMGNGDVLAHVAYKAEDGGTHAGAVSGETGSIEIVFSDHAPGFA